MPMMIAFDKLAYSPGSVVSGHVVIIKKSPEKVKGLSMRFIGRSSKLVSETDAVKNYKKEVYFDEKFDVFGHDGTNTLLKIGESLFPFTFNLPHGLPSSFMWPSGNILYFVEAKLTRSSWKDDKRVSSRIQVEGIFDLNLDPLSLMPAQIKRHKYIQHILSKSGPCGFTFKLSRSGFVRGHSIPFWIEIKNLSKIDAKKLRISLLQEVSHEGKVSTTLVEQLKGPAVHSGEIQVWEARLKVPCGVAPTNLGNVLNYPLVLSLQYFIHIQLSLKSATVDALCAKIPVVIGTIALFRSRDRQRLQQLQQLQGNSQPHPPHVHEPDCPLSQLSPSQFTPPANANSAITVHSSVIVTQNDTGGRRSLTPSHLVLGPTTSYDYYRNHNENAGATSTLPGCYQRSASACAARLRHPHHQRILRESPPPSYDEVISSPQNDEVIRNRTMSLSRTVYTGQKMTMVQSSSPRDSPDPTDEELMLMPSSSSQLQNSSCSKNYEQQLKVAVDDSDSDDDQSSLYSLTP